MSTVRIPIPHVWGNLSGWVGFDVVFASLASAVDCDVIDLQLIGTHTQPIVVRVHDGIGNNVDVTIPAGEKFASRRSPGVQFTGGNLIFQILDAGTPAGGSDLSGSVQVTPPTSVVLPTVWLTTLERVKQKLRITDGTQDATLNAIIAGMSGAMQKYMRRNFVKVSKKEQHTASVEGAIPLDDWPWDLSGGGVYLGNEEDPMDASDYEIEGGLLWALSGHLRVPWRRKTTVRILGEVGYAAIPSELDEACAIESARAFKVEKDVRYDVESTNYEHGTGENYREFDFLPQTKVIMGLYRKMY